MIITIKPENVFSLFAIFVNWIHFSPQHRKAKKYTENTKNLGKVQIGLHLVGVHWALPWSEKSYKLGYQLSFRSLKSALRD